VTLLADGRVKQVAVKHGSGKSTLDSLATRIVRRAEPFPALPPAIRKQTDVLAIIQAFRFRPASAKSLSWKQ